jgi:hypothetical protein
MKRRAFFAPAALLLAAFAAGMPAHAADAVVPVTGIVSGQPESVSFSGEARIQSRLVQDADFGRHTLLLTIDLSGISGTGSSSATAYAISTQQRVQRRLAGSHVVTITFPFAASDGSSDARSGMASFALDFDVNTGAVTKATGSVSAPNF